MFCLKEVYVSWGDERRLLYTVPRKCKPGPSTLRVVLERERPEYERVDDYCLFHRPFKLVAPRAACDELEEIMAGRPRKLLVLGPPGTGKSLFLKTVARVAPFDAVEVEPEQLKSKWYGETEKNFKEVLDRAEASQPSILLIDEGDMLISPREEGAGATIESKVSAGLIRMFLRRLQKWSDRNYLVSIILTSNYSVQRIETAILRAGRFDRILYFPPPEPRGIKLLAQLYGRELGEDEVEELLRRALTYSNIVEYLRTGKMRDYQPLNYARVIYVRGLKPRRAPGRSLRLVIAEDYPVGFKLAALLASSFYSKPVAILTNHNYYQDFVFMGESLKVPIAFPYNPLYERQVLSLLESYSGPVFLVGKEWRVELPRVDLDSSPTLLDAGLEDIYEALGCPDASSRQELLRCLSGFSRR